MDQKSLRALLALVGLVDFDGSLEGLLSGKGLSAKPELATLIHEGGRIVAAWYSIHANDVEVSVVGPNGSDCRTRFEHPAWSKWPTHSELWDQLYILLSGTAARMVVLGRLRAADCVEDLQLARDVSLLIAAHSPFPTQPWSDTPRKGRFALSSTYASKPSLLVAHTLDVAYRQARLQAQARKEKIEQVADILGSKGLLLTSDLIGILGERTYALNRQQR